MASYFVVEQGIIISLILLKSFESFLSICLEDVSEEDVSGEVTMSTVHVGTLNGYLFANAFNRCDPEKKLLLPSGSVLSLLIGPIDLFISITLAKLLRFPNEFLIRVNKGSDIISITRFPDEIREV
jgi:hypothetical protein